MTIKLRKMDVERAEIVALVKFCERENDGVLPRHKSICRAMSITIHSLRGHLKFLRELGAIELVSQVRCTSRYRVLDDSLMVVARLAREMQPARAAA